MARRSAEKTRTKLTDLERDMLAFLLARGEATSPQLLEFVQDGESTPTATAFYEQYLAFRSVLVANGIRYKTGAQGLIRITDTRSILKATMLCYPKVERTRVALPPLEAHA